MMPNKWGKAYWQDLGERVASSFLGALLATLTLTGTSAVDWSNGQVIWTVLGVPTLVTVIKGLLANLSSPSEPSASVVGVTSNKG